MNDNAHALWMLFWLVALWLALWGATKFPDGASSAATAARKTLTIIATTGVVLWALLFFHLCPLMRGLPYPH